MPPWKADPSNGPFVGQHPLSDARDPRCSRDGWTAERRKAIRASCRRRAHVDRRLAAGKAGSRRHAAAARTRCRRKAPTSSASSRCRFPSTTARFVRGLEFRPGQSRRSCTTRTSGSIRRRRRAVSTRQDPAPGYDGLIARSAIYPDGHFLGWTPGQVGAAAAAAISRGASIATPISSSSCTCSRAASRSSVAPSIGLYFGDTAPTRTPAMLRLGRQNIDIPAGRRALHRHRLVRAAGGRRGAGGAAARALSRCATRAARRRCPMDRRSALVDDQGLGLPVAARLPLRDAGAAAEGHDAVDALRLRQLGGEPAQPAAAAGARALGAAIVGRDGRPLGAGADARRRRSRRASTATSGRRWPPKTCRATKSRSRSTRTTPALHDDAALLYLELGRADDSDRALQDVADAEAAVSGRALQPRHRADRGAPAGRGRAPSIAKRCGSIRRTRTRTTTSATCICADGRLDAGDPRVQRGRAAAAGVGGRLEEPRGGLRDGGAVRARGRSGRHGAEPEAGRTAGQRNPRAAREVPRANAPALARRS